MAGFEPTTASSRKIGPEQVLADAKPPFRFVTLEMGPATAAQRGKPNQGQILDLAERLKTAAS